MSLPDDGISIAGTSPMKSLLITANFSSSSWFYFFFQEWERSGLHVTVLLRGCTMFDSGQVSCLVLYLLYVSSESFWSEVIMFRSQHHWNFNACVTVIFHKMLWKCLRKCNKSTNSEYEKALSTSQVYQHSDL